MKNGEANIWIQGGNQVKQRHNLRFDLDALAETNTLPANLTLYMWRLKTYWAII